MTQNYKLSPEEYKTMSGSSWPPYSDYLQGNLPKKLALEINKYEQQFSKNKIDAKNKLDELQVKKINKQKHSINASSILHFLVYPIIPAILGLWLYFYLDGTIEKFIILFFLCRLLNILWVSINHKWLCHHQFEPKKWARPILLFFIVIGGFKRNDPTGFIKAHTAHHKDKDTVFDPYPPTWGFWNNALLGFRYYQTYPFGRWMVAPDIKFVFRNLMWLRIFYWTVIGLIDIHVFLLSFVFMEVYVRITGGIESFLYHDGFGTKQPVDRYAYLGYPIMLFLGESWIHGSHHDRPWVFNNGKENPKLIDIEYQLLRVFADTKQNK